MHLCFHPKDWLRAGPARRPLLGAHHSSCTWDSRVRFWEGVLLLEGWSAVGGGARGVRPAGAEGEGRPAGAGEGPRAVPVAAMLSPRLMPSPVLNPDVSTAASGASGYEDFVSTDLTDLKGSRPSQDWVGLGAGPGAGPPPHAPPLSCRVCVARPPPEPRRLVPEAMRPNRAPWAGGGAQALPVRV